MTRNKPSRAYMKSVKESAAAQKRRLYVWELPNGEFISSIHLSMVPYYQTYWSVSPDGAVIRIAGKNGCCA